MDSFIYSLVLVPALTELLPRSGIPATTANVGYYGGIFFTLFLIGYGTALIWGTDCRPELAVQCAPCDVQYFVFFFVHSCWRQFATGIWSLLRSFRFFMAGVGIGGEWSIGASLISEDWPEERRTMGAALMHTGYYIGFFLAGIANIFIGSHYGWRAMFALGGVPALLIGLIRNNVQEPARWENKVQELRAGQDGRCIAPFLKLFYSAIPPPERLSTAST